MPSIHTPNLFLQTVIIRNVGGTACVDDIYVCVCLYNM